MHLRFSGLVFELLMDEGVVNMFGERLVSYGLGVVAALLVTATIYFGSGGFAHFDPALKWYAFGSVLAAFAVVNRFAMWTYRPPSRLYFKRGIQLLLRRHSNRNSIHHQKTSSARRLWSHFTLEGLKNFLAQHFIFKRNVYRWVMHWCLSGGCTLAFAVTFPLVFGWIHFETLPENAEIYQVMLFGISVDQFHTGSLKAALVFNVLNISAILVCIGLGLAVYRRLTDPGEKAIQTFYEDWLPLILIFIVTITGLMLTISYKGFEGKGHSIIAFVHMLSVLALLFYIPFGKLFHMFQRSCSLFVSIYKKEGQVAKRAHCYICQDDFASQMHVDDLKTVLDQLKFNYRFKNKTADIHYQEICPSCRRRGLAVCQGESLGR